MKKYTLTSEPYPSSYEGYPFLSLIIFNNKEYINIINTISKKTVSSYVLDLCTINHVDESKIINIAYNWYSNNLKYPISVEFSKMNYASESSKILRTFSISKISRIIGPIPALDINSPIRIKKRKQKINK